MLIMRREISRQRRRDARLAQVHHDRAGIAYFLDQRVELGLATRHQHQPLAPRGACPREVRAQPGRRAGDQGYCLSQATVAFTILPGLRTGSPVGSASTCSMPLSTSPQTVY